MKVVIEVLPDGMSAFTNDFKGIHTNAESWTELKENLEEVIKDQYDYLLEQNKTKEAERLKNSKVEYLLDLSQLFKVFNFINKSKFAEYIGVNTSLFRQYTTKPTYISEERLQLINNGLHRAGAEMLDVNLT